MSRAGRILTWLRGRLRGLRYLLGDVLHALGGGLRAVGRVWRRLSLAARRRIAAAVVGAGAVVLLVVLAVPNLPCSFPGGDRCPPPDDAEEIVPADSLAYVHLALDPDSDQVAELDAVREAVPGFSEQIMLRALALAPGPSGAPPQYESDIEPWFGGEAALAVVPGPGLSVEQVVLMEAADTDGAAGFADAVAAGVPLTEDYRGVELSVDDRGVATAHVEGFLVVGTRSGVHAIVDTATGAEGAAPLADDELATSIREELPDHRFLEAWVSGDGAVELAEGSRGLLSSLAPFIAPGSTEGAAASVSATDGAIEIAVRSELDPEREGSAPGFFSAFPSFEASISDDLATDTLAYVGFGDPARTVRALLGQAAAEAPGIAAGFEDLVESLRRSDEIDIERDLLPALGEEGAFAVAPAEQLPYLEFIAKGVDEARALAALAALQGPLAQSVDPGSDLQAPVFGEQEVAGQQVRTLRVSPTLELAYAVFEELAVVATNPAAIASLAEGEGGLDDTELFERATEDFPDEASLLGYFDLGGLIDEGFAIGLAQVPAFNTFAGDFRNLEALGLSVRAEEDLLASDARLLLGG